MAQDKKRKNTAYQKKAGSEFQKGVGNAFTGGGSAAYQPRDANTGKTGQSAGRKKQTEKSMQAQQETFGQKVQKSEKSQWGENSAFTENKSMDSGRGDAEQCKPNHASKAHARKQMYQTTSGQKVQKSGAKPEKEEKPDFVKENNNFTGQENFSQPEEAEKKQPDTEDYHRRDTYRQSQKKGKYHKKRVQKEHRGKGGTNDKPENKTFTEETFTENTGNTFQGEGGSEFTGSKKLQKKQRQAQKAGRKVQKARAKLPKTREYTLQRVFDEKTGKGKYVVVPLDKEKTFKQEGIPKTTMRRVQNESKNFVHGKIAETEKENSAVEGAHKSEQKVEALYAFVKRQIKGKEQKQQAKVAKLEKKQFKKEVNFQYQKFLEENPQMQKKALQKRLQKQRIKREYVKARKKAAAGKTAEQAFQKTKNGAVTVARKLQEFARKNAGL
ncbi:peptidase, partial [bacterium C-53]